jgi:hypothetical protein
LYSTVRKDTGFNNTGTQGLAWKLATAKTQSLAGTSATAGTPATAGMRATAEMPTTPWTPATVKTSGTPAIAGMLATKMTQATTVTPTAAEMPEIVLTPTPREFFADIREKRPFCRTDFSQTDSIRRIGSPLLLSDSRSPIAMLVRYSDSFP